MNSSFIPLISVVIGGLLTIIGGFLGNYFTQSIIRKSETKKLIREKIEEIYNTAGEIKKWLLFVEEHVAGATEPPCPIDKMVMLVSLYVPKLKASTSDVRQIVEKAKAAYYKGKFDERATDKYLTAILKYNIDKKEFNEKYNRLVEDIEIVSQNYI